MGGNNNNKRFGGGGKKRKVGWWERRDNKSTQGGENQEEEKKRRDERSRKWNDVEVAAPHPGSFATLEMRKLYGYPEVLEEITADTVDTDTDTAVCHNSDTKNDGTTTVTPPNDIEPPHAQPPSSTEEKAPDHKKTDNDDNPIVEEALSKKSVNEDNSIITAATAAAEHNLAETTTSTTSKAPKRKLAFLVGFLGQNYSGFQINEGQRTLQAELEYAMYKAGLLEQSNFGYPAKYGWSTSARTDKGVHACAQVCSAKLRFECELDAVREKLNACLPHDMCVMDVIKVPRAFNAKNARNKVRYQYMVPSFLLQDRETLQDVLYKHAPKVRPGGDGTTTGSNEERQWRKKALSDDEAGALYAIFKDFRATEEQKTRLAEALQTYEGTHSYHNYTKKKSFGESSSSRFIMKFYTSDPVISSHDGMEWIPTHVVGQSFLLNQIRKMISMAVDVARGAASLDSMRESFRDRLMRVNIAPAQGLFLEMSYYEFFNERQNPNQNAEDLDWSSEDADPNAVARWRNFKEHRIMPRIMQEEGSTFNFVNYLYIHESKFNFQKYLHGEPKEGEDNNNTTCNNAGGDVLAESSGDENENEDAEGDNQEK
jgi:tRNA pseudouridine38-40 synthase